MAEVLRQTFENDDLNVLNVTLDYLKETGITREELSKRTNIGRPTISQYLSGTYNANTTNIEAKILRYLDETGYMERYYKQKKSSLTTNINFEDDFFVSNDVKNMMAVCQSCQESQGLGIIVGRTGFGKTLTLKRYGKLNKVCYIECDDTMGCRDLIEAIEKSIGLPSGYGSIWKRAKSIKEFFSINKGYLLIIDEADKLITKYTQKKIEILRTIFDQSNVGLVIAGEPALESLIKGYLPRFANRVDFYSDLKGLSKREAEEYIKGRLNGYEVTDEVLTTLVLRATNYQTGCFRLLNRTLNNVTRLEINGTKITSDLIDKASRMMML